MVEDRHLMEEVTAAEAAVMEAMVPAGMEIEVVTVHLMVMETA